MELAGPNKRQVEHHAIAAVQPPAVLHNLDDLCANMSPPLVATLPY
jgi:hypothetical protein